MSRDPAQPLKGKAEPYAFARACGYGIWDSARRAGANPETGQGSKWEARADVQARIAWWRTFGQNDEMLAEKRRRLENELELIGYTSMDDFVALAPTGTEPDIRYLPVLDLTRLHEMPEAQRRGAMAAVKTIRYTENGPTFELHGKLEALAQLRDMHGFKASTKHEMTGKNGGAIEVANYSDADRAKALLALMEKATQPAA